MVFGTFDGIHEGHRAFLKAARQEGDYLIAVIPQDHVVEALKGRKPRYPVRERLRTLEMEDAVDQVVMGDGEPGAWEVVRTYRPDVIAVGYDQKALEKSLRDYFAAALRRPRLKRMPGYKVHQHRTSLKTGR